MTLSRAAAPEWIITRPPAVTACRGRHFAPSVKQTLFRRTVTGVARNIRQAMPIAGSFAGPNDAFRGMCVQVIVTL